MIRHTFFIILFSFAAMADTLAQEEFRNPVQKEAQLEQTLFELEKWQQNHIFQAVLPGDNFLLIDFYKMSYYPDSTFLQEVFDIAAKAASGAQDSFKSLSSSKRIDVHMPVKNRPQTVRLQEHGTEKGLLVLQYDQQAPLKLSMDTIRVLKTFAVEKKKDEEEVRSEVQYTLIIKSIDEMAKLAENKALVADIAQKFDSVVQYRRSKWSHEDIWYHEVGIKYNPIATEKEEQLIVKHPPGFLKRGLELNYYVGASVFRNNVVPYLEVGAGYKWPGSVGEYDYVALSFSTMAQFERINESTYNFYNTGFTSIELGTYINKDRSWIPLYETSIGFGYMFTDHPSLIPYKAMKMFWNYSLSPAVRITPDFYILFKPGQENDAWTGITLSIKFL